MNAEDAMWMDADNDTGRDIECYAEDDRELLDGWNYDAASGYYRDASEAIPPADDMPNW